MLVLFETPAGYALFSVKDNGKLLADTDALAREFATPQSAAKLYVLGPDPSLFSMRLETATDL